MRYALLAASLAFLGSAALAAQSAIAIQHDAWNERSAGVSENDYEVAIMAWDETAEGRRYLLARR